MTKFEIEGVEYNLPNVIIEEGFIVTILEGEYNGVKMQLSDLVMEDDSLLTYRVTILEGPESLTVKDLQPVCESIILAALQRMVEEMRP